MAVPKLADELPFWRLEPDEIDLALHRAASIKGAAQVAVPIGVDEMPHIDLVVCGSVAVERSGARLGKGGGYSDLEFAIGVEAGIIDPSTVIATTVHPCQILEPGAIPLTDHDFGLDLVVTPDEVIRTRTAIRRPSGVLWGHLDDEKKASIPVLDRR
jgi:5-formyltetrahydrofolate cyclo-ligase